MLTILKFSPKLMLKLYALDILICKSPSLLPTK